MVKEQKGRPVQIRLSLYSFLGLILCWLLVGTLAFYGGTIVGRMAELRDAMERASRVEKIAPKEDALPLRFSEDLSSDAPPFLDRTGETRRVGEVPGKGPGSEVRAGTDPIGSQQSMTLSTSAPSNGITEEGVVLEDKVLQIGAFRELERAEHLVQGLKAKGYPAYIVSAGATEQEPHHRVFVGPFPDPEAANQVRELLEGKEGLHGILLLGKPAGGTDLR
jgi:hypothetical protein